MAFAHALPVTDKIDENYSSRAQSGFNEVQVLHMSPRESHYAGGVVILSVIGLAVLVLLMVTVAALFQPAATSHDSSDQFVTAPKAEMRASAPGIPV